MAGNEDLEPEFEETVPGADPWLDTPVKSQGVPFPSAVGYVYAMVNRSAWPGLVKLGQTGDIRRRFYNYQTGDPYRGYVLIAHSPPCSEVTQLEKEVHAYFEAQRVAPRSEWFRIAEIDAIRFLGRLHK